MMVRMLRGAAKPTSFDQLRRVLEALILMSLAHRSPTRGGTPAARVLSKMPGIRPSIGPTETRHDCWVTGDRAIFAIPRRARTESFASSPSGPSKSLFRSHPVTK